MIVGVYDIVENRVRAVEIDPTIPRYFKLREDLEAPTDAPNLVGFSPEGLPILHYWAVARDFERAALAAFKAAVRGQA